MLEFFRNVSKNVIFKIFMGVLLLSFVLSGVTGLSHMNFSDDYLVKVGNERITQAAVDHKYDETVRNIRRSGLDFSDEQLAGMGVSKPQMLRMMVQESLVRQEVADLGIEVGDETIAEQIKNIPQFQTDGKFDREKFKYVISGLGKREADFTKMLRDEIKTNLLMQTVAANIPQNDYIEKLQAAHYGERRDIEIAIIPKTLNVAVAEPNDEQLKEFYDNHAYEFQIPENRDLNFIRIKKTKENEKGLYDTTVKIEDELAGGSTLKEVADKMKLKVESKANVKDDDEELPTLLLETAFDKAEGETSELVYSDEDSEYFVVEVTKVRKASIPELESIKDKIITAWKDDSANDANLKFIDEQANELRDSKEDLQKFAAKNGYKYEVIKNVRRKDTETHGARLVDNAFAVDKGEVIGSFQNEDGTYKIAKLKDIHQTDLNFEEQVAFKGEFSNAMKTEVIDQMFEGLRKKFGVKQKEVITKESVNDQSVPVPPKPADKKS